MIPLRSRLATVALTAVIVVIGLTPSAPAQSKGKGRLRVEHVRMSPLVLHLNAANGPTCGTATLQVTVQGLGEHPNPRVVVDVFGYSTFPPGIKLNAVNLRPVTGEATLTAKSTDFTFTVCVTGGTIGGVIVRGAILGASPAPDYEVEDSDSESTLAAFVVSQ